MPPKAPALDFRMNKYFSKVLEAYAVVFCFFTAAKPLSDGDFWFHLKTGEYIVRTRLIPRTELFSFTHFGRPWVAHGWLSGLIFYGVSSGLGIKFLIIIFGILTALAFWIVYKRCNSNPLVAVLATITAVWTAIPNIGARPRVFSILFSSIFITLLTRYARRGEGRTIWWLVPMMVLWANLHGGFFIGLALVALTIVGIVLDAWSGGEKISFYLPRLRILGLVMVGCLLAPLLNPYGIQIYTFPLSVLNSPIFQNVIVDWLSPNFHDPGSRPLLLLILVTTAAIALSPKRVKPSELILFLTTLYATLKTQRNAAIFALVAAPIFAEYAQNWLDSKSFGKSFRRTGSPFGGKFSTLITLLLLLSLVFFALKLKLTMAGPFTQEALSVPLKAVEHLNQNGIAGNTFVAPNIWGGYLIWEAPANPVYYDGRDVYPEKFVAEFVDIIRGNVDWRAPFDRYGVQIVLIEPKSMLARVLEESPEWEPVYRDDMSVVFKRR